MGFLLRPKDATSTELRAQESEILAVKWMSAEEFIEQAAKRMPPGSVYYTLNELAVLAATGNNDRSWTARKLALGPKLAPGVTNTVFLDPQTKLEHSACALQQNMLRRSWTCLRSRSSIVVMLMMTMVMGLTRASRRN